MIRQMARFLNLRQLWKNERGAIAAIVGHRDTAATDGALQSFPGCVGAVVLDRDGLGQAAPGRASRL
jgi:hypothetical protein